jgi:hypothetical protein
LQLFVDFISSNIVESGKYKVIDRLQRETILNEIEFSLTGCTDESCQLEAGKLLQANEIVLGSIGTFGNKTLVNIKLIEVETGAALSSVSEQYDSFNEVIVDNKRIVNRLLNVQAAIMETAEKVGNQNAYTSLEIFKQTDELIKTDLSSNFQLIKSRAQNLSPEERKALYKANDKDAVSGSLLNILPGFGLGSFINNDPDTGVLQVALDVIGLAGVTTYFVNEAIWSSWFAAHQSDWVANPSGTDDFNGEMGNFIVDGEIISTDRDWSNTLGIVGLVVYGVSKIVGALIPAINSEPYNAELGSALNLNN